MEMIRLKWQADNLIGEIFFEEVNKKPNIDNINILIKRLFHTWSAIFVFENKETNNLNEEQILRLINDKYMEYFYLFGQNVPKAVVKIKKLNL